MAKLLQTIYDAAPHMFVCVSVKDATILSCNQRLIDTLGYRKAEVLYQPIFKFYHKDVHGLAKRTFQKFKKTGIIRNQPLILQTKSGNKIEVILNANGVKDSSGEIMYSSSVLEDVTELNAARREIQKLNGTLSEKVRKLEQSNQELTRLNYTLAHDLRAPLRHVMAYSTILKEEAAGALNEDNCQLLDNIFNATSKLGQLIDELLEYSRLGKTKVRNQQVNLEELLPELQSFVAGFDDAENIEWGIGPLPVITADPIMIKQVLNNLLSNAVKFSSTRSHPQIKISCSEVNGFYRFKVADNGVGFNMKYQAKLFELFERLHEESEFPGTGIGLANVKQIIQKHHGEIWAESKEGEGATFYFTLPK